MGVNAAGSRLSTIACLMELLNVMIQCTYPYYPNRTSAFVHGKVDKLGLASRSRILSSYCDKSYRLDICASGSLETVSLCDAKLHAWICEAGETHGRIENGVGSAESAMTSPAVRKSDAQICQRHRHQILVRNSHRITKHRGHGREAGISEQISGNRESRQTVIIGKEFP